MDRTRFWGKPFTSFALIVFGMGTLVLVVSLVIPLIARPQKAQATSSNPMQPFTLTSPNFQDGGPLPQSTEFDKFSCHGANIAPALDWFGVPQGTDGFAFTMTDYDAPVADGFHHWVVYNIPASASELDGNSPFSEGTNSFGTIGFGGPCPPADGQLHHYVFRLYALSISQVSGQALTFDALLNAINNAVIGTTSIVGTFKLPI